MAASGLNSAQRRLERYGYNELESAQAASPLTLLLGQFRNVLIIVLLAAAGLSAIVGEVIDALISVIGLVVMSLIEATKILLSRHRESETAI